MNNSNVTILNNDECSYTVRLMDLSAKGGVICDNRAEHFLIVNVSPMNGDKRLGCMTAVFEGGSASDIPTRGELADHDLAIVGTWARDAVFGNRFNVAGWYAVKRQQAPVKPSGPPKTRRLNTAPVDPAKPAKTPVKARRIAARRTPVDRSGIASTNDWYSQTSGQGDSLDFLSD